jgi:hypothetical protein
LTDEQTEALPLKAAYNFGAEKGVGQQINVERQAAKSVP